jgi:hypothetical protein
VRTAHGILPNPSPAVVGLLEGVPTWGRDINVELTTPTGAAILAANSSGFGPMPPMRILASGFGAGEREIDGLPNCTQVVLGEGASLDVGVLSGQTLVLLEANIDDATGETLAQALSRLLEAGANDAWLAPILMKKGRPGHVLSVLADPALADELSRLMRAETACPANRTVGGGADSRSRRGRRAPGPYQGQPRSGEGREQGRRLRREAYRAPDARGDLHRRVGLA